ncbi:hypothetical protein [Pseudomonas sp. GV071]|uniref:hypothetical protein n=1 Tax=Pseudomonas sp. GV071 TaxID=2135754 RepID=UPI000D3C0E1A|nr:hypothetical protein [Pseudomonas sp. GV071]PTQ69106.1 hypothetical protein C8K61_109125 [Pseudomonas sp. GV071]
MNALSPRRKLFALTLLGALAGTALMVPVSQASEATEGYFVILRLYGPTKPFFEKTWKPGDLNKR